MRYLHLVSAYTEPLPPSTPHHPVLRACRATPSAVLSCAYVITLGWGADSISPDGCVVLTTYIKVVGMVCIVMFSCLGCGICCMCLLGKKE